MTIGIYGGAFDPPHLAHVELAKACIAQFKLDQMHIVPTGDAWHKRRHLSPAVHRVAMAKLAFADVSHVVIDEREIERGGASYTIDTVLELQLQYPGQELILIIGQDQLTKFHTWHRFQDILERVTLRVATRGGSSVLPMDYDVPFKAIDFPAQSVSSSDIRQAVRLKSTAFAAKMPASVAQYIQAHGLYLTNP